MRSEKLQIYITIFIITSCLFYQTLSQQVVAKVISCIQFKNRQCIRCPDLTHMKNQQCYQNIQGCSQYLYGTASAQCKKYNNTSTQNSTSTITLKNSSYFYSQTTVTSAVTIQSIFRQISLTQALKDSLFLQCNNYMRRGEYSHFISRSQNPVRSVFQSNSNGFKNFKILYEGSGGNLLMCIIQINSQTNAIILRSFVTIGRTQIIDQCVDYSAFMQCSRCRDGFHLDQNSNGNLICMQDIPGCLQYYSNICIRCRGHYMLVQNRCISDCQSLRDSRGIRFYGGYDIKKSQTLIFGISRYYF